jgi:hypothetical protein
MVCKRSVRDIKRRPGIHACYHECHSQAWWSGQSLKDKDAIPTLNVAGPIHTNSTCLRTEERPKSSTHGCVHQSNSQRWSTLRIVESNWRLGSPAKKIVPAGPISERNSGSTTQSHSPCNPSRFIREKIGHQNSNTIQEQMRVYTCSRIEDTYMSLRAI